MLRLSRTTVFHTLVKQETLPLDDFVNKGDLGIPSSDNHLQFLLEELVEAHNHAS